MPRKGAVLEPAHFELRRTSIKGSHSMVVLRALSSVVYYYMLGR